MKDKTNIKTQYFSFSQINTFYNCPERYKLLYINRIKKKHEGIEAFMGKIVHEVLEWIYKYKEGYIIWDNIEDKYKELWSHNWHNYIFYSNIKKYNKNQKGYFKLLGLECLRNYYNIHGPVFNMKNVRGAEIEINFKINEYTFKGIIDRIDENEDSIEIHDYKTGKPQTIASLKNNFQPYIYHLAIESINSDKNISIHWHYLKKKNNQCISISISKEDKEKIIKQLLSQITKIEHAKKENSFAPKESYLCNWCYLWDECSAKSIYNKKNPSINVK